MYQVKVYDGSGNLKKVISVKALHKRSDMLVENPSLFRKNHRNAKSIAKTAETYYWWKKNWRMLSRENFLLG